MNSNNNNKIYNYKNYNNKINEASVEFYNDDQGLNVKILTNNLFIRNVRDTIQDKQIFINLLTDPTNTVKYGSGVQTIEEVEKEFNEWVSGWKNNDVCSGLMVFDKIDNSKFIGHIMLMHGKVHGEGELAIILHKDYWGKGLGSEMMDSMVHCFSHAVKKEGYKISTDYNNLDQGLTLFTLFATARVDNFGSIKVIEKAGLKYYHQQILYGAERKYFRLDLSEILDTSSRAE